MSRPSTGHYDLAEAEKRDLFKCIETGKPLPERHRFLLFQTLEHIDELRKEADRGGAPELFDMSGRQTRGWANKLIWDDNKLILSSLKSGALRRQIEEASGLEQQCRHASA